MSKFIDYARTRTQYRVAEELDRNAGKRTQREMADRLNVAHGTFASAKRQMVSRMPVDVSEFAELLTAPTIELPPLPIAASKATVVGVIGDTHLPYEHRDYLQFCKETFEQNGVNRVVHIGDLIDNHSLSFHDSEPSLRGSRGEYEMAWQRLQPWFDAFPEVTMIYGNHDAIPARQMKKIGLDPDQYMRPIEEVYDFPTGWSLREEVEIDGVLYHHGHTACGVNGFRNDSKARFRSTVTGHAHGNSGVSYTAVDRALVYGCAVGCGIDNRSMAFAYGKGFKNKPIISCAVIKENGLLPQVFPMGLGDVGRQ